MSRDSRADKYKRNAQGYFNQSMKRDELLKAEQAKSLVAANEKILRLRALRLKQEDPDASGGSDGPPKA